MIEGSLVLLFVQQGCPACAQAAPEFEKFKQRNPFQMALTLDADGPYAERFVKKQIRETPLYMLKLGDEGITHAGVMKAEQVEKWVNAALKAAGVHT